MNEVPEAVTLTRQKLIRGCQEPGGSMGCLMDRVSFGKDENIMEMESGRCATVPGATEVVPLKW